MSSLLGTISKLSLVVEIRRSEFDSEIRIGNGRPWRSFSVDRHFSGFDLELTRFISTCRGDEEIFIMPMHASIGLLMDEIASFEFSYS